MSRRARMLKLDQRSGRLERAIHLMEDGQRPGLMTRDADRKHPQSARVVPGPDRGSIKPFVRTVDRGTFNWFYGQTAQVGQRSEDSPILIFGYTYGSFDYDAGIFGYSHSGYGSYGYSGLNVDSSDQVAWGG